MFFIPRENCSLAHCFRGVEYLDVELDDVFLDALYRLFRVQYGNLAVEFLEPYVLPVFPSVVECPACVKPVVAGVACPGIGANDFCPAHGGSGILERPVYEAVARGEEDAREKGGLGRLQVDLRGFRLKTALPDGDVVPCSVVDAAVQVPDRGQRVIFLLLRPCCRRGEQPHGSEYCPCLILIHVRFFKRTRI